MGIRKEIHKYMSPDYDPDGLGGIEEQWLADVVEALRDAIDAAAHCNSESDIERWCTLLIELPPPPPRPKPTVTYRVIRPGVGGMLDSEVIRWSVEATPGKQHIQIEPDDTLTAPGMPGGSIGKPWRLQRQSADPGSQTYWLDVARSP